MIIITGMHRSGTSAIANMIYELGVDFGDPSEFIGADEWNVKGYYESKEVTFLNNSIILGDVARTREYWMTPNESRGLLLNARMTLARMRLLYLPLMGRQSVSRRAALKKEEIIKLSTKYKGKVVKDTRFSLTISDWMRFSTIDKVLYCYRHPIEVAMSLKKRYRLPLALGYILWRYHVTEFFKQIEGVEITIVNYNNFFIEEHRRDEVRRLFNFLGTPYEEDEAERLLGKVFDSKLRHNIYQGENISNNVKRVYKALNDYHNVYSTLKPFESS